jgi:cation:H+ antiporter
MLIISNTMMSPNSRVDYETGGIMILALTAFLGGLTLLLVGSELVTRQLGPVAQRLHINELVVTVLGVSVLSSLPELMVSGFAAARGQSDVSLGNVVGSNFVTLTFVTAVCALIKPIETTTQIKDRESSWMILSTALVLVLGHDGRLGRVDGAIMILCYLPYIISVIAGALKDKGAGHAHTVVQGGVPFPARLALMAAGLVAIIFGADWAVSGGQILGEAAGIPPLALGVVLFAFGTSLPELSIAVSATLKGKSEVSIGEVYASNTFTMMVVLGVCALINPLTVSESMTHFALPFLVLASVVIQGFITTGMKLQRWEAVLLLGFYGFFVYANFNDVLGWTRSLP